VVALVLPLSTFKANLSAKRTSNVAAVKSKIADFFAPVSEAFAARELALA